MPEQYYTSRSVLSLHSFGSIEINLCLREIAVKPTVRTLYEGTYTNSLVVGNPDNELNTLSAEVAPAGVDSFDGNLKRSPWRPTQIQHGTFVLVHASACRLRF